MVEVFIIPDSCQTRIVPSNVLNRSVNGHLLSAYRHMAEKALIALSDE
jgi:hypothetical protein